MSPSKRPTVLLTGANSGIGLAAARRLARRGVRLIVHARTEDKAARTREELAAESGNDDLEIAVADLRFGEAVQRMTEDLKERHGHLDVLINNAGLAGGQEHTWTVNVLAPFRLSHGLRPLLAAAAGEARVLNVASVAQTEIDLDSLPDRPGSEGPGSYGQSKLAVVMLSFEMARRWRSDSIMVNALHPGTLLDTRMVREHFGSARGSPDEGGAVLEYLALSSELHGVSGEYFRQKQRARAADQAYDEQARRRLWRITARMAELAEDEDGAGRS
jgi:NAD(P)-dependent dehydrogenase (short-subunit alcohol dehydrogenase family)